MEKLGRGLVEQVVRGKSRVTSSKKILSLRFLLDIQVELSHERLDISPEHREVGDKNLNWGLIGI